MSFLKNRWQRDFSQADQMLAAAEDAGTQLMVNWPTAWSPALNTAMNLIKEGAVGDIFYFKWRSAHNGPDGNRVFPLLL